MGKLKFLLVVVLIAGIAYAILFHFQKEEKGLKVVYMVGKAFLENQKKPLQVNDVVPPGISVKLEEGARCFLQMSSGAVIKLSSQASLRLTQDSIQIEQGSMAYNAKNSKSGHSHPKVVTPHGEIGVESVDFAVSVEKEKATISVHEGSLQVASQGQKETVEAEKGCVVEKGKISSGIRLPRAPKIKTPGDGEKVSTYFIHASCEPILEARHYEWEYALDQSFVQISCEHKSTAPSTRLPRPDEDGTFFLRVRVVGEKGFSSEASESVSFSFSMNAKVRKFVSLAHNYYLNDRHEEVIRESKKGMEICPDHVDLQKYCCLSLVKTNAFEKALEIAKEIKKNDSEKAAKALQEIRNVWKKQAPDSQPLKQLED